jgi:hypothetical protein
MKRMKKILLTLAAILCCTGFVQAQEERNRTINITLGNVQYAHHDEKMSAGEAVGKILAGVATGQTSVQATKFEEDVKNGIVKGLSAAHRFRFDPDGLPEESGIVVDALITNIQANSSTYSWKDNKGKTQVNTNYSGVTEVMLTLRDAATGEVLANPSLKGTGTTSSTYSTSDRAILEAISRLATRITEWLNEFRPLEAQIIEGAASKKDKQKEVYIDLGSKEGAYAGMHLGVFAVRTVAGREAKTQIGKLKIETVEGEELSRCKVQSGGKDIKAAIDAGEQLVVVSID